MHIIFVYIYIYIHTYIIWIQREREGERRARADVTYVETSDVCNYTTSSPLLAPSQLRLTSRAFLHPRRMGSRWMDRCTRSAHLLAAALSFPSSLFPEDP